ncbi:glycosyltransferase family 9 protein [Xanthobacter aminoxidans]|uniref:Glycosyltransferase family 9 protein n=1 Tax=Xanthobacter aminoxidans TaxID=186280 RepID=A0ABW6ZE00_9HYPH
MKRLIIYRLGSLGDTIIALPFFRRVAELYPDHERIVLTNVPVSSKAAPLLSVLGTEIVHGALSYPVGTRSPAALWDLRRRLMALGADTMIYMMPSRGVVNVYRDLLFFKLCGFRSIIGVPYTRDLDTCRISPQTGEEEPECERVGRALAALGPVDLHDPANWDLALTPGELAAGRGIVAPIAGVPSIAINMGGKAAQKDWGVDNWRSLLGEISQKHPGHGLLVVGAAEDSARVDAIRDVWRGPLIDACGALAPRESAAAMQTAQLFIGHDSGPLHLASAAGVPCIGLFGDFNRPRKWHPYVGRNRTIHDMRGVRAITVDQVVAAVAEQIG